MKKFFIIIFLLGFYFAGVCQFPVGKNIHVAEKELKQTLKNKGFTFLKAEDEHESRVIKFSEEFEVIIGFNSYDNVSQITFLTFKNDLFELLKSKFNFDTWAYKENRKNEWNDEEVVYEYKNYEIGFTDYKTGARTFTVSLSSK